MPDGVKAGTAYVDVDADLAKLKKTVDAGIPAAVDGAAKKASDKAGSRFAGIGGHLKKGLVGSLGEITGISLGAGVTGIGAALDALSGPAEAAKKQLEATFAAAGQPIEKYKGQIASVEGQMENYAHTNTDTDTALRKLTSAFQDPKKALKEMGLVADIAAAKHISLAAAADLDVKAHAGSTKVFKQFGINVTLVKNPLAAVTTAQKLATSAHDKYGKALEKLQQLQLIDSTKKKLTVRDYIALKNAQDNVNTAAGNWYGKLTGVQKAQDAAKKNTHVLDDAFGTLSKRLKGQASASVDSFSGKLSIWKTKIQDVAAQWGAKLGPILTTAGPLIAGLGGILSSGLVPGLGATAAAEEGVGAASTSMLGPIALIIAGIALLVAGVIYAYTHFTWFKDTVDAIGRWFRDVLWPIIQTVAMDIWGAFKIYLGYAMAFWATLWRFLKATWDTVGVPIFNAIVAIVKFYVAAWKIEFAIAKAIFSALWVGIKAVWNTVGRPLFEVIKAYLRIAIAVWKSVFNTAVSDFRNVWHVMQAAWNVIGVPIFNGIKKFLGIEIAGWSTIFGIVTTVFSGLWTGLQAIWNTVGVPLFDAIKVVVNDMRWAFDGIKGPIEAVFGAISGAVHTAMHAAVHVFFLGINAFLTIAKGAADAYNSIPGVPHIQGITTITEPKFHQGGIYRAPPGHNEGLALLRDGERVLTPEQDRKREGTRHVTQVFNIMQHMTPDQIDAHARREERLAWSA